MTIDSIELEDQEAREVTICISDGLDGSSRSGSYMSCGKTELGLCKYGKLTATNTGRRVHCRSVAS